jgi:carbon-monoxide dehydrogenase medium subunit
MEDVAGEEMAGFEYHRPRTLQEAWQLKQRVAGARYVAGGTDLMVRIKNASRSERPPALISLRGVEELGGIDTDGEITRIGALTTIADLLRSQLLRERYPALVMAAGTLGSPQIRNAATVGGNLCNASPCADTAPPLLVYGARVRLESAGGTRELALEELFLGPGETPLGRDEVLTRILLDPPPPSARALFFKKGRVRMDLAQASVAVLLVLDQDRCIQARIAAGSVAPTPVRLKPVEQLLGGKKISETLLAEAQQLAARTVAPISDLRSTEEYRRQIVGVYVKRAARQLMEDPS